MKSLLCALTAASMLLACSDGDGASSATNHGGATQVSSPDASTQLGGDASYAEDSSLPLLDTGLTGEGAIDPDSACADIYVQAADVPLDLYFMLDVSGSMIEGSKMTALLNGIKAFLTDPASAGIGATAREFPLSDSCGVEQYAQPAVPWQVLPNPALTAWIESLAFNGYTPTGPALSGAVKACQDRMSQNPTHRCATILVTDGRPEGDCSPKSASGLGDIAEQALNNGIPVFAIGFPGLGSDGEAVLASIAQRGGTTAPVVIEGGDVGKAFVDALEDIRRVALGCEYQIPKPRDGELNPALVEVFYTPEGATQPQDLPQVGGPGDCAGDGWYYDDPESPTKLIMCPATCEKMQGDTGGDVQILLGCESNTR